MWIGLMVLPVCGLVGWWLFLRLARHVYDRGGAADLRALAELAERYRLRLPPRPDSAEPPDGSGAEPADGRDR